MRVSPGANAILDPGELATVIALESEREGRAIDRDVARSAHACERDAQENAEASACRAADTERDHGFWGAALSIAGGVATAVGGSAEVLAKPSGAVRLLAKVAPAVGQVSGGASQGCSSFGRAAATEEDGIRSHHASVASRAAQRASEAESRIAESRSETRRALDLYAEYSSARTAEGHVVRG